MRVVLFNLILILAVRCSFSQCMPNPIYADGPSGFWPDSISFIENNFACGGLSYSAVIEFKSFVDTSLIAPPPLNGMVEVKYDAFRIETIEGLPSGFYFELAGPTYVPNVGWLNTFGGSNTYQPVQGCLRLYASDLAVAASAPTMAYSLIIRLP